MSLAGVLAYPATSSQRESSGARHRTAPLATDTDTERCAPEAARAQL